MIGRAWRVAMAQSGSARIYSPGGLDGGGSAPHCTAAPDAVSNYCTTAML